MIGNLAARLFGSITRRLNLEEHEQRLLLLMGALVATLFGAYTIAKVLRDALFIAEFGALSLPYGYIGVALAAVAFVWLESRVARRFKRVGATRFNQYAAIGISLVAAAVFPLARQWTTAVFYIWAGSQAMMLLPHFWGLALDVWDSRRARAVFPLFAGCGLIGGLVGGAFAGWSTPIVKRVGLMWVLSGLLIVAHLLTRVIERHRARRPSPLEVEHTASPWGIIRRSRYIQILAAFLALSVIVSTLVDFQFKVFIQRVYPDPHALTQFLGKFYVGLNALALLFQFSLGGWLMYRFGLGPTTGLQPITAVLFVSGMAFTGGWWVVVVIRWIQGVVFQTLGKSTAEIYYMAVRPHERRRIKPAVDTLVERWSDAVVGVLLIVLLGTMGAGTAIVAATTAVFVAVWVVVLFLLNREYGAAFEHTLSSRWLEPDVAEDSLRLPAARRALLKELRGEDETRIVLALKLSERLRDAEIARAVRGCLRHPSPAVRAASVGAMEAMGLQDSEGIVEGFLGESHEGLRRAAVGYLLARGPRAADFARRMLEGEDATLRQYTVDALFDNPSEARTALTLTWVDARLETGAREDLLLAARALGAMTGSAPVERLRALLANPDVEVRRAALLSAVQRPSRELLDVLLPLLLVPELSYEARQAVAAVGAPAVPGLKRLLDGEQGARGQALAARTLARIASPRAVGALMALVKSREPRLRDHGFQSMTRVRVETGKPVLPRSVSHKLFLRELADYRRFREPALWLEGAAAPEVRLLADTFHESEEMALQRALGALACWYEPRPLSGSFERLKSREAGAAAPALEYLGHVLPHSIFRHVSKIFEEKPAKDGEGVVAESEQLAESIRVAWRSEDSWVRACAVRASKHAPGLDPGVFEAGGGNDPLVLAELSALPGGDHRGLKPAPESPPEASPKGSPVLTAVGRVLILKAADLLNDVGPRHLLGLAGVAREVEIRGGDTVYNEADPADALYMVIAGRVRLSAGGRTMSEVGPGESFGTWSLVDDSERGHRADCVEDGLALALRRDEFYEMAAGDLVLLQEVVRGLAKRLRGLVVERPHEARVEGEGVEKTESVVQAETAAVESATAPAAAPAEAAPAPPTRGASLTAAALGRPQPEGEGPPGASPAETPGENASTDIVPPKEPPAR